jgi:exosortase
MHHATYGYAFAVLPVMAFLLWHDRSYFRATVPTATPLGSLLAIPFATAWLIGAQLGILEMQHLALAGMLVALAITAIGLRHAMHFWLPLAYVFLLAPAGSPLLPCLQQITTRVAVMFLELGQIRFYAEGLSIEVATGTYLIAPGCAGLNFVLALATVAPLFVVLMYNSWTKRLIALALMMAIVPLANGFRVFAIIAIAEYSNRAIDIAADHLLYGWIFFSIVVLVMFWVGSGFADQPQAAPTRKAPITPANVTAEPNLLTSLALTGAICAAPAIFANLQ